MAKKKTGLEILAEHRARQKEIDAERAAKKKADKKKAIAAATKRTNDAMSAPVRAAKALRKYRKSLENPRRTEKQRRAANGLGTIPLGTATSPSHQAGGSYGKGLSMPKGTGKYIPPAAKTSEKRKMAVAAATSSGGGTPVYKAKMKGKTLSKPEKNRQKAAVKASRDRAKKKRAAAMKERRRLNEIKKYGPELAMKLREELRVADNFQRAMDEMNPPDVQDVPVQDGVPVIPPSPDVTPAIPAAQDVPPSIPLEATVPIPYSRGGEVPQPGPLPQPTPLSTGSRRNDIGPMRSDAAGMNRIPMEGLMGPTGTVVRPDPSPAPSPVATAPPVPAPAYPPVQSSPAGPPIHSLMFPETRRSADEEPPVQLPQEVLDIYRQWIDSENLAYSRGVPRPPQPTENPITDITNQRSQVPLWRRPPQQGTDPRAQQPVQESVGRFLGEMQPSLSDGAAIGSGAMIPDQILAQVTQPPESPFTGGGEGFRAGNASTYTTTTPPELIPRKPLSTKNVDNLKNQRAIAAGIGKPWTPQQEQYYHSTAVLQDKEQNEKNEKDWVTKNAAALDLHKQHSAQAGTADSFNVKRQESEPGQLAKMISEVDVIAASPMPEEFKAEDYARLTDKAQSIGPEALSGLRVHAYTTGNEGLLREIFSATGVVGAEPVKAPGLLESLRNAMSTPADIAEEERYKRALEKDTYNVDPVEDPGPFRRFVDSANRLLNNR